MSYHTSSSFSSSTLALAGDSMQKKPIIHVPMAHTYALVSVDVQQQPQQPQLRQQQKQQQVHSLLASPHPSCIVSTDDSQQVHQPLHDYEQQQQVPTAPITTEEVQFDHAFCPEIYRYSNPPIAAATAGQLSPSFSSTSSCTVTGVPLHQTDAQILAQESDLRHDAYLLQQQVLLIRQRDDEEAIATARARELAEQQQQQQQNHAPNLLQSIKKHPPFFTILITSVIVLFYIYGVFIMMSDTESMSERLTALSPPIPHWAFFTVDWWPSCIDLRSEHWRVFTLQFLHVGIEHLLGNILATGCFGCILEVYHPLGFIASAVIFQTAVVLGALGHSLIFPFIGLVGCSMGTYGYIGACWGMVLFESKRIPSRMRMLISMGLMVQFCADVVTFIFMFHENTSYASHISGWIAGFSLSVGSLVVQNSKQFFFGVAALTLFIMQMLYLVIHYLTIWPPAPPGGSEVGIAYMSMLQAHQVRDSNEGGLCCAQAYDYYFSPQSQDMSLEDITSNGQCYNGVLYVDGYSDD